MLTAFVHFKGDTEMKAYLQFGGAALGLPNGPFQTMRVNVKETVTPRSGKTVSGYGSKLPTPYMIELHGKWRRVYAACYGNAATLYVGKPGAWECTVDIER